MSPQLAHRQINSPSRLNTDSGSLRSGYSDAGPTALGDRGNKQIINSVFSGYIFLVLGFGHGVRKVVMPGRFYRLLPCCLLLTLTFPALASVQGGASFAIGFAGGNNQFRVGEVIPIELERIRDQMREVEKELIRS